MKKKLKKKDRIAINKLKNDLNYSIELLQDRFLFIYKLKKECHPILQKSYQKELIQIKETLDILYNFKKQIEGVIE